VVERQFEVVERQPEVPERAEFNQCTSYRWPLTIGGHKLAW